MLNQIKKELKEGNRVEVLTEGSGICFIYQDDNKYYFVGEGANWQPIEYNSIEELFDNESYDFVGVV